MRIIFEDGGVLELSNVNKVVAENHSEFEVLDRAINGYFDSELKDLNVKITRIKEEIDELVRDS